jgi:Transglutaminase-like superfamily
MRRRPTMRSALALPILLICSSAHSNTTALIRKWNQRELHLVRHFEFSATPGRAAVGIVPALIPLYSETNWQTIKTDHFEFSETPDSSKVTSSTDKFGVAHRDYQITWNAAKADKISIDQALDVELTWFNTLYTSAKLPYDAATLRRYAASLSPDPIEGILSDSSRLEFLCSQINSQSSTAAQAVEGVCDWIADNVDLEAHASRQNSDETLSRRDGDCGPVSILACAMLRHMGIPAELVGAKFVETPRNDILFEAYYPDAGWIFYDIQDNNIGYKSLDCVFTVGWSFFGGPADHVDWHEGDFCDENDAVPFWVKTEASMQVINRLPQLRYFSGVLVSANSPPLAARIRRRSVREILLDTRPATGL